ncbi:MAG TPA: HAMP domain-containing sensor histidine kinase [Mycobacteriales bacterium]|nr:HAMP domain-containing sensor histidine kinase [Mycobacteriales bacterium]
MNRIRRIAPWWHGRPLRVRITVGVLILAAGALAAAGAAAEHYLRSSLVNRLDAQIDQETTVIVDQGVNYRTGLDDGTIFARSSLGRLVGDAHVIRRDPTASGSFTLSAADVRALTTTKSVTEANLTQIGRYRLHSYTDSATGLTYVVGMPLSGVDDTTHRLLFLELIAFGSALIVLASAGAWFVRREMRPVEHMAAVARHVADLPLESGKVDLGDWKVVAPPDTEVGQLNTAFNRMIEHVEESLTARNNSEERLRRFVADASHELRTPLASIRGYAELFRQPGLSVEDRERAIARVESESQRMTGLVDDLLLLARLDASAAGDTESRQLERAPVDLGLLAADAAADLRATDPSRPVDLDLPDEVDADDLVVLGDEARLRQVLANLTGNARVHTPPGTPVAVRVARDGDDVILGIEDAGPGIPESLRPSVFERFTRADGSRTRDTGGSGLGLSIVAAIASAHGGSVTLDSRPGRTIIVVRLPAATVAPEPDSPVEPEPVDITPQPVDIG